jgi:hypothetical protein
LLSASTSSGVGFGPVEFFDRRTRRGISGPQKRFAGREKASGNLERAVGAVRQTEDIPDQLVAHLSPLGWEHVNLTGDYIWSAERPSAHASEAHVPAP